MTTFTILGISVAVILGTLFVGFILASTIFYGDYSNTGFYSMMFMIAWIVSTAFLILQLIDPLMGK